MLLPMRPTVDTTSNSSTASASLTIFALRVKIAAVMCKETQAIAAWRFIPRPLLSIANGQQIPSIQSKRHAGDVPVIVKTAGD